MSRRSTADPEPAACTFLPHLWFRNTWAWGYSEDRPELHAVSESSVKTTHKHLGERWWSIDLKPQPPRYSSPRTNRTSSGSSA